MNKISAVIITKNEELNIARCLEALSWVDEIIIVDSRSDDKTVEIAERYNAKVIAIDWIGYGPAKQEAVKHTTHDWVLSVDADEVVTPELADEIKSVLSQENTADGYLMPRKTNFMGRWINHSNWYPDFILRFFNKTKGGFNANLVHEAIEIAGPKAYLKNDLLHYSYPTLDEYFRKSNIYTRMGAQDLYAKGVKAGFFGICIKPIAAFIKHYFLKKGFLDGVEGFLISFLSAIAVMVKYAKLRELMKQKDIHK